MHDTKPRNKMPELFRHPHSLDVRGHVGDMLKTVAGRGKRGETYLRDGLTVARGAPLKVTSIELGNSDEKHKSKLIVPIRSKMTVIAHNPPPDVYAERRPYSAEDAIHRLDEFYFRHIDETYLQSNMRPMLMFRELMGPVFEMIHKLDRHCLFHVRALQNSTLASIEDPKKREELLRNDIVLLRIILRDEYLIDDTYDFKADVQIIGPSAALAIAAQRLSTQKGKNKDHVH